ncbi:serine hydrolase domain-containing protein [Mycobacterium sp. NPDC003323]
MRAVADRLIGLCTAGVILAAPACAHPDRPATHSAPPATAGQATPAPVSAAPPAIVTPALAHLGGIVDRAIVAHRLPGAVVQIGHGGHPVYRQAFGVRRLAGEPGLDAAPAPAEPMTTDTIFDLASLTKPLATATAVMQLHEQGSIELDDPLQSYLPGFNPDGDPRRARVTLRMLLTHTSGIAGDLSLDGPWGLDRADKDEGIRRAMGAWVVHEPGTLFHYSDIGFILLGTVVEKLTGRSIDSYVAERVFAPLGMADSHYLPAAKACGPHRMWGNALAFDPGAPAVGDCPAGTWRTELLARVAPTAHDGDTPGLNPDFGRLLRGTVHDPTARRMGGATGSAGVFTTAADVGRFAQALLDRLAGRPSAFPLSRQSLERMTTPQASVGGDQRGLGWDIDTAHSAPRGAVFPVGSFGHTGFTGTSLWLDPGSDTYVVVLANVIHQPGGPPIGTLSGQIATATARALRLYGS